MRKHSFLDRFLAQWLVHARCDVVPAPCHTHSHIGVGDWVAINTILPAKTYASADKSPSESINANKCETSYVMSVRWGFSSFNRVSYILTTPAEER